MSSGFFWPLFSLQSQSGIRARQQRRPRLDKHEGANFTGGLFFISLISFMSFIFMSFVFMLQESPPQQQHSCLSEAVAPFFIAPSFIERESPQQPEDTRQHDSIFLL